MIPSTSHFIWAVWCRHGNIVHYRLLSSTPLTQPWLWLIEYLHNSSKHPKSSHFHTVKCKVLFFSKAVDFSAHWMQILLSLLRCDCDEQYIIIVRHGDHVFDQQLLSSAALSEEKRWHIEVKCLVDEETEELTSLSQSLKAEMRVKTVGFFTSLQVWEETKLVTPWTNHLPSWPKQFRGPPESPWRQEKDKVPLPSQVATTFFAIPHTHCIQIRCLLPHKSWWSWRRSPTNRFGCTRCVPPRAAGPAAACLALAHGLRRGAERNVVHKRFSANASHVCFFVCMSPRLKLNLNH